MSLAPPDGAGRGVTLYRARVHGGIVGNGETWKVAPHIFLAWCVLWRDILLILNDLALVSLSDELLQWRPEDPYNTSGWLFSGLLAGGDAWSMGMAKGRADWRG